MEFFKILIAREKLLEVLCQVEDLRCAVNQLLVGDLENLLEFFDLRNEKNWRELPFLREGSPL